ncbi:hypothetical protein G7Z17_g13608 [Cylindrodendrum hubeiense]|uniref:Uncharacterized protein n=1 Tax=Cylindrodendrum hubeiense TaxID=595255 RepID=A0A9P5GRZ4_9HYPO|nr:hypothetical protein G7Z17_g13608 [Cylindrodendrum hubeiense]
MSAKTSPKKGFAAKVLGRRLSRAILRPKKDASPAVSRPQTSQPQTSQLQSSPRSSITVTNPQRPVSMGGESAAKKRLSRHVSIRQRFWSASSSNYFECDDDADEQNRPAACAFRRSAYIPRHAASDFSKNSTGVGNTPNTAPGSKHARQPCPTRLAADEANARISRRFSTVREDDERTLCSQNEGSDTTAVSVSGENGAEIDTFLSSLRRDQALQALNKPNAADNSRHSRQSAIYQPWATAGSNGADDSDHSSEDEYGVYRDEGESRQRGRRSTTLWAELDAKRRSTTSFDGLNTDRSSFYSNRNSFQPSLQDNRNSFMSNLQPYSSSSIPKRNSVLSNRSSVYSTRESIYLPNDAALAPGTRSSVYSISDAIPGADPVLHRSSTYLEESTPKPEPLAVKRNSGFVTRPISEYLCPPGADAARTKSLKRRTGTAKAPTIATVMEIEAGSFI